MAKNDGQVCAYLEAMAAKVGGNATVYKNFYGDFTMQRVDGIGKSVRVRMDEPRESFNAKVKKLMEGKRNESL